MSITSQIISLLLMLAVQLRLHEARLAHTWHEPSKDSWMVSPSRIALLGNPDSPTYPPVRKSALEAAKKAGLLLVTVEARNPQETENAFAAFVTHRDNTNIQGWINYHRTFYRTQFLPPLKRSAPYAIP